MEIWFRQLLDVLVLLLSISCVRLLRSFVRHSKTRRKKITPQPLIHVGVFSCIIEHVLLTGSKSGKKKGIDVSWLRLLRILPVKCKIGREGPTWSACKWDYRIADGYTALLTRRRRRCIDRVSAQVPFLGSCSELLSGEWEGEFKERALKLCIVSGSVFSERQLNSMMPQSCFELSCTILRFTENRYFYFHLKKKIV